jgi:outer membrane lipoprotein SlyB
MNKTMLISPLAGLLLLTGCATPTYQARQSEINSAAVGALAGGVLGGVLGNNVGDNNNEVLGAAIGTASGAWLGQQYGKGRDNTRHRLEALESQSQTETVMVKNTNGSYNPVVLTKVGYGQYRGPRGEIYTTRPTEEQLAKAYAF